jgi:YbbR domain-containing protein
MFILIDTKVINLVKTEAEEIRGVPVVVKYNEEAYVIEGVPDTVDITLTGRKSDIYLAKQLGEYEVVLDLSEYTPSDNPYKVYFSYSKPIHSLTYKLDPSYVQVMIKNKESQVKTLSYDLLNINALDSKLSVKSVSLNKTEVVVKGGSDALAEIASVKALIDLAKQNFTEAGTHDIDNVELVAYDSKGNKLTNIEIVPGTISATVILESYSKAVPVSIETTGELIAGKAIASILVNGNSNYSITIYGDQEELDKINSVPVTINVDGLGKEDVKEYNATINKPNGVRKMSAEKVKIKVQFGEEKQKTIDVSNNIAPINLSEGLTANLINTTNVTVQVKGVESVINKINNGEDENKVDAYIDLSGLGVGEHEVEVKINNTNPLVSYVVSSKIKIKITQK